MKMDILVEKLQLIEWLAQVQDEEVISQIKALRTTTGVEGKDKVVAYTADGRPLTEKAYDARLAKGEEDFHAGRVTSQEELEEEVKNW